MMKSILKYSAAGIALVAPLYAAGAFSMWATVSCPEAMQWIGFGALCIAGGALGLGMARSVVD